MKRLQRKMCVLVQVVTNLEEPVSRCCCRFRSTDVYSANELSSTAVEHTLCELYVSAVPSNNDHEEQYSLQACDFSVIHQSLYNDLAGIGAQFEHKADSREYNTAISHASTSNAKSCESSRMCCVLVMVIVLIFGIWQFRFGTC